MYLYSKQQQNKIEIHIIKQNPTTHSLALVGNFTEVHIHSLIFDLEEKTIAVVYKNVVHA